VIAPAHVRLNPRAAHSLTGPDGKIRKPVIRAGRALSSRGMPCKA